MGNMDSFSYKLLRTTDNADLEFSDSDDPNKRGAGGRGREKTHVHVGFQDLSSVSEMGSLEKNVTINFNEVGEA